MKQGKVTVSKPKKITREVLKKLKGGRCITVREQGTGEITICQC